MKPTLKDFLKANLAALLRGRFFMRDGHLPPAGHTVPEGFAGVGVATNEDPATDAAVIAILRDAGIRRVRLDFTYGDEGNHVARFFEALIAADIDVLLHLVQPPAAARVMPADAAENAWRDFIRSTLERFGKRIRIVEACSTVNRKRWAGYSLDGFLAAWRIAFEEVRKHDLQLAGPSVTDFEPVWNIGLLRLLRDRNQLPDLHTDNLFSERCAEPERWDHKILGHRLAPLIRFNLIRKARLLQRIGADFGMPRLMSPSAFWTLPRIERFLPDSEQKQADYLARYMVLCAASGALEAAWWGPLVCHREGLVDDGPLPYPKLERITHYAAVDGKAEDFRTRPALAALATFNSLIPGTRYEGKLNSGHGLEVHEFKDESKVIHVVWTINASVAALEDIYSTSDLAAASIIDRDGITPQERPTLASESPLYLSWPASSSVQIKAGASVITGAHVPRHAAGKKPYFIRKDGVRGIVLATDAAEAFRLFTAIHPSSVVKPTRQESLRHARNAIWTIHDPDHPERRLVLKQPVRMPLHKRLLDRNKPSKGLRSWSGTNELLRRGIGAAAPIAWVEQESDPTRKENIYACEFVDAELSARELMGAYASGAQEHKGIKATEAYAQLSAFLRTMHGRGVFFRDLSGGNILIERDADENLRFTLIDTGRIRTYPHGLTVHQRMADLVRVGNKLNWEGRERLMEHYLGKPMGARHRIQFRLYDWKVSAKRRFGRKAFKRLLQNKNG
ncbi:MAG: lipopolysaccharide kinase InaA family protein [Zoogloeaceae bacterium]|nr:lipopolysaccharide kinase InaA family protein [Zoogloeaceae bacterium]